MKALTVLEMRSLESAAMAQGQSEEELMQAAGERLALAISRAHPFPGTITAYLGKGHNAGDALVCLKILGDYHGWEISIRPAYPVEQWAPLTRRKLEPLGAPAILHSPPDLEQTRGNGPRLLLDALLGIGAKGALREPLLGMAREMAQLRSTLGAKVIALDLPSGIDPDTGEIHPETVIADATYMIGAPKIGLLSEHAANVAGALHLVPVPVLSPHGTDGHQLIAPYSIASAQDPRPFSFHKGNAGRVGILAGSREYSGAAVLASMGALAGGAGLVTLHLAPEVIPLICGKIPPEIILRSCEDPGDILHQRYDALVIGCGLHSTQASHQDAIRQTILRSQLPTVVDAEGLNLLSATDLAALGQHHLLTPHLGEFARLAPDLAGQPREEAARIFADRTSPTLLLKGSRTIVTRHGQPLWFNPTGTPGMATGGQGDLLSGVLGALLAIGNPPLQAAAIGAWLCGRAAERALLDPEISPQSLRPTDVALHIGGAFRDWSSRLR